MRKKNKKTAPKKRGQKRQSPNSTVNGFPRYIRTLRALCAAYKRRWPELRLSIRPQTITHWKNGRSGIVPHPEYNDDQNFVWKECEAWFEQVMLPRYQKKQTEVKTGDGPLDEIDLDALELLEKRREIEDKEWDRQKRRGQYVKRDVAMATGLAAIKHLHLLVRSEDERHLPQQRRDWWAEKLKLENLPAERSDAICAEYLAWEIALGKNITDRRETAMEQAGQQSAQCETKNEA